MGAILQVFASWVAASLAKIGVGVVTYATLRELATPLLSAMQQHMDGLPSEALGVLTLAGVPDAMGIMLSAHLTALGVRGARLRIQK